MSLIIDLDLLSMRPLRTASYLAGTQIVDSVLQSTFFKSSKHTGIYLTCKKLREVDTSRLLEAMLAERSSLDHHCAGCSVQ